MDLPSNNGGDNIWLWEYGFSNVWFILILISCLFVGINS